MINFLNNLAINLRASGPAAAFCVWFVCIAAVAVFAPAENAKTALATLTGGGAMLVFVFGRMPGPNGK